MLASSADGYSIILLWQFAYVEIDISTCTLYAAKVVHPEIFR